MAMIDGEGEGRGRGMGGDWGEKEGEKRAGFFLET